MKDATAHRLVGYLRVTLVFVGVLGLGLGYGLWWAAQMLVGNGCETTWFKDPTACQQTLLALQNQYLASLIAGIIALVAAAVLVALHRRAVELEQRDESI